jgi:hypothetical protein
MAETKFTTSFIPKKPVATVKTGGKFKKSKSSNIISLISFVIFFIVLIIAVGTFLYKAKLENDIKNQIEQLAQASEALDQQFIFEASRLDNRLKTVKRLLDNHLSPSQIFVLLEEYTIANLRFSNLGFSFNGEGNLLLSGNGSGLGYESIIQQSDAYGQSEFLRDVIFSNLQNNEQNVVNFSFESVVDPRLINYRENLIANSPNSGFQQQESFDNNTGTDNNIMEEADLNDNGQDTEFEDSFDLQQELINEQQ